MRPAGALALVALGFFAARWTSPPPAAAPRSSEPVFSRIRYVQPEASGRVQLVLEETRQRVVTGDPQDESIHRLLLAAARDAADPGLRVESMDILKARPASNDVRAALLHALQQDPNPGVRLKALDALRPYVAQTEVRGVLAKVLLSDENPGVRTQAIDLLTQQKDNEAMVGLLQQLIQKDDNTYVRLKCRQALQDMNASVGTF
jgi:HEAT repeat protein